MARAGRWLPDSRSPRPRLRNAIDRSLVAAAQHGMHGNLACAVMNPYGVGCDHNPYALADQLPWHRVGIAVDLDRAVAANPPNKFAGHPEGCNAGDRLQ